jgi:prepilin-type N-terminal cleavage/methylation domain-containing protein
MATSLKKRTQGFTIIEVLIVLAIAGLILLIVFLAVPALQRNSRNTQRRSDVSRMLGGLQEATNNNNGTIPASLPAQVTDKLSLYTSSDVTYANVTSGTGTVLSSVDTNRVYIGNGLKCISPQPTVTGAASGTFSLSGANAMQTTTGASVRSVTAVYAVETTGNNVQIQCTES